MPSLSDFEEEMKALSISFREYSDNYVIVTRDYDAFINLLRKHGMDFCVRHSQSRGRFACASRFMWGSKKIDYCGIPFAVRKRSFMMCVNGGSKANSTKELDHTPGKLRRNRMQPSKKIGCPATMRIVHLKYFPKYEIVGPSSHRHRVEVMKRLREDLIEEGVEDEDRFVITVSKPSVHSHEVWTTFMTQTLNPAIKARIRKHVDEGITDVPTLKALLEDYVKEEIDADIPSTSRSFYPTNKIIYNYVLKYAPERKKNKIDYGAIESKIKTWEESDGGKTFFRSCSEPEYEPFLFCYQNHWQRGILDRYGDLLILDPTYRTMKYSVPLYSLIVKTNVSYMVIGIFVVQWETPESISEAIDIFKSWNPSWNPKYVLVDFRDNEITAIKACFNCPVYISDFHREQEWTRWFKKTKNIDNKDDAEVLLKYFRQLAKSTSYNEYTVNENAMSQSEAWNRSTSVQNYYNGTWLPIKEKWAQSCFDDEYLFIININNGIESQQNVLKHASLKHPADKSIAAVLDTYITQYLPEAFRDYQSGNCRSNDEQDSMIPQYLLGRPPFFVKHVQQRYNTAARVFNIDSLSTVNYDDRNVFLVKSETQPQLYSIDLAIPFCSCPDFYKFRFPCKHICALIILVPDITFDSLPSSYSNSPYINIDHQFSFNSEPIWNEDEPMIGKVKMILKDDPTFEEEVAEYSDAASPLMEVVSVDESAAFCLSSVIETAKNILEMAYSVTEETADLTALAEVLSRMKSAENCMRSLLNAESESQLDNN